MEATVATDSPALTGHARPLERRIRRRPRDPLEHLLALIWERVLGVDGVGLDEDFAALGGEAHRAGAVAAAVEEACDVRVEPAEVLAAGTLRELAWLVRERSRPVVSQRCRSFPAHPGAAPLFFVHGDPNGVGLYCKSLAGALGPDIALHALTPHGPYGPAPLDSIPAMADFHVETLRRIQPRGPYLLGGFCLGALVALEMARRLEAEGEAVPRLILIGPTVWSRYWGLRRLFARAGRWLGMTQGTEERLFLGVRDAVQPWFALWDRWRARRRGVDPGRFPPVVRLHIARRGMRTVRRLGLHGGHARPATPACDAREAQRQRFWDGVVRMVRLDVSGRWSGRLVILWPEHERLFRFGDPEASWRLMAAELEVHTIPGRHNDALVRHVAAAGARIAACLAGARAPAAWSAAAAPRTFP